VKPAEVSRQIRAGETSALYLLEGDDPQARHALALEFAELVDEDLRAFNVQTFHAAEAASGGARDQLIGELLTAARTLPMMAPRRVIVVHDAERLLSPRRAGGNDGETAELPGVGSARRRGLTSSEELERYLSAPEPLTTLVFVADALDQNRRLVKLVRQRAVVVDCGAIETPSEAARWIRARLERERKAIEPEALTLLIESVGLRLGRLRAEVEKLVLFAADQPAITTRHVRELVVPRSEPGDDFPLGRAIWNRDAAAALAEIAAQLEHGHQPPMVLGQIRAAVGRLKPERLVVAALDAVLRTDLDIKSSAAEPQYLLERLVIELCARAHDGAIGSGASAP
jgi:DNA polymerase-3 subunit delta